MIILFFVTAIGQQPSTRNHLCQWNAIFIDVFAHVIPKQQNLSSLHDKE